MDWLEFTADVIGSVAWPLALVVLGLVFKKPVSNLIGRIRRGTWRDGSLEFAAAPVPPDALEAEIEGNDDEKELEQQQQEMQSSASTPGPVTGDLPPRHPDQAEDELQQARERLARLEEEAIDLKARSRVMRSIDNPTAAIFESWGAVESEMEDAADRLNRHGPPLAIHDMYRLVSRELSTNEWDTFNWLRTTRNQLAHTGEEPPLSVTADYVRLARLLAHRLSRIERF